MKRTGGGWRIVMPALALTLALGCEMVAGIEDHVYDPAASAMTAQCQEYCSVVMQACTGTSAVYATTETCLGVCARLPPGDPLEPSNDNSVACRKRQAELAMTTAEPAAYCPQAGPGGAGTCGTNCGSYCSLLKVTCPSNFAELPNCEQDCAALKETGEFDVVADHSGDTIECRLVHVSSATVEPDTHCIHTQIHPTSPCVDDLTAPPSCEDFCRLNLAACTGDNASYESKAQCMAVCAALPAGTNGDRSANTVGCRQWHTYNALLDPPAHCSHAAAGGDGHCGANQPDLPGNCESYCALLQHACVLEFSASFATQADCQIDCSRKPQEFGANGDSKYSIAAAETGNTLQCRLLHVSRALSDATECTSAAGQGSCQ